MKTIGQRIASLRISKGLTQGELAHRVGVTASAINQIESGLTKKPKFETVARIAAEFGVDVNEIGGVARSPARNLAVAIGQLLRKMPATQVAEVAKFAKYEASQVTELFVKEAITPYIDDITELLARDDDLSNPKL